MYVLSEQMISKLKPRSKHRANSTNGSRGSSKRRVTSRSTDNEAKVSCPAVELVEGFALTQAPGSSNFERIKNIYIADKRAMCILVVPMAGDGDGFIIHMQPNSDLSSLFDEPAVVKSAPSC